MFEEKIRSPYIKNDLIDNEKYDYISWFYVKKESPEINSYYYIELFYVQESRVMFPREC